MRTTTSIRSRSAPGRRTGPAAVAGPAVPRPRAAGVAASWLPGAGNQLTAGLRARFRLPGRRDPAPHPAKLAGTCVWAAGLGLVGLPVAGRCSVAILAGAAPRWFEPVVVTVGMLGIAVTVAAFAAIHRRWLPWHLLAGATVLLAVNLLLTLML